MEQSNKPTEIKIMANHSVQGKPLDFSFLKIQDIQCKFPAPSLIEYHALRAEKRKRQEQKAQANY